MKTDNIYIVGIFMICLVSMSLFLLIFKPSFIQLKPLPFIFAICMMIFIVIAFKWEERQRGKKHE